MGSILPGARRSITIHSASKGTDAEHRGRRLLRSELARRWEGEPPSARAAPRSAGRAANGRAFQLGRRQRRHPLLRDKADRNNLGGFARLPRRAGRRRRPVARPAAPIRPTFPRTADPFEDQVRVDAIRQSHARNRRARRQSRALEKAAVAPRLPITDMNKLDKRQTASRMIAGGTWWRANGIAMPLIATDSLIS